MTLSHLTKDHIISSFKVLAEERPFHRISILEITRKADINKNTFYYHFEDRSDLVKAVFRVDFGRKLEERFSKERLIYGTQEDKYRPYPFYVNARTSEKDLDLSDFFEVLGEFLLSQMNLYAHILCSNKPDSLSFYLHDLYRVEMRKDVQFALGNNATLGEDELEFLSSYATSSCFGWLIEAVMRKGFQSDISAESKQRQRNITHELMKYYVREWLPQS